MRTSSRHSVMRAGELLVSVVLAATVPVAVAAPPVPSSAAPPAGMIFVPAGTYEPLYKNEGEQAVAGFFLDETPVTNSQYLDFVRENPRWRRSKALRLFTDEHYLQHWAADLDLGAPAKVLPDGPVTNVSWFAARAYAKWKHKRLPKLAEWEMAAAASTTSANGKDDADHYRLILEWYSKPTRTPFPAVTGQPANFFGVRGLHGLVWEWVEEFNTALVTGESRADAGLERNLFCGAGAAGASDFRDYAAFMRYAFRSSLEAKFSVSNLGFRCAMDVPSGASRGSGS